MMKMEIFKIINENIDFETIISGFDLKSRDHITVRKTPGWSPEMKVNDFW